MSGDASEALARRLRQRVRAHAVVLDRLRRLWRHPSLGYLVAVLGQVAAVSLTLYLRDMWPRGFPYQGVLPLVVVIAVALRWDFGPSLLATLVGVALVDYYVLPPYAPWSRGSAQMGAVLAFVAVGLSSGILGSRAQRARLQAEAAAVHEHDLREKAETALREQAELLDLAHDAIIVRDPQSTITFWSRGAARVYGWSAVEALGRVTHDLLRTRFPEGQNADTLLAHLQRVGMWEGELVHTTRAGDEIVVESRQSPRCTERGRLAAILEINRDVTARKRAEGQLASLLAREQAARVAVERTAGRIARLQAVTAALAGALTPEDIADAIVGQGLAALGATRGSVVVLSDDATTLRTLRLVGYPAEVGEAWREFPVDTSVLLADAVRARDVLTLETAQKRRTRYPHLAPITDPGRAGALVAIPLLVGERATGAIGLSFPTERHFDVEDRAFMLTLADLCAQALDRARLYEAERRARTEAEQTVARLERLQTVATALAGTLTSEEVADAIIAQGVPVLGADFATVAVVAESGQALRLLRVTGLDAAEEARLREIPLDTPGHLPEAVRTGTIVACASAAEAAARYPAVAAERAARGLEAGVALPLRVGARIIGGLTFIFTDERRFTDEDLAFLGVLADLCAQALDRARLYEMERQAHLRAAAAVRERDTFLSVAAHELKTPLTSLRGFTQILLGVPGQGGPLDPARTQRALRQIEAQTGKLSLLVDQLLDVARLETGRLALDCRETDLTALAADVAAAARVQTDRHTVTVDAPPSAPAWVDPLRLEQVLTNLVGNALKYSPEGGPIALTLDVDPGGATVRLAVRDRGLGIPEERRAHIFDRFYQAHADHHRSGLGLGLYISHEIVALHGGRLDAEFPEDGGARFIVTLPTGRRAGGGDLRYNAGKRSL